MRTQASDYIIGVDGGGTHSRAICSGPDGHIVAFAKGRGTSPSHNTNAFTNTQAVLHDVIAAAGIAQSDINVLAAGLAGLDNPDDLSWATENTDLLGFSGSRLLINDSHIALAGAFCMAEGILSVAGTGTITTGLITTGKYVTNYDFGHYSRSGAQHIGRNAIFELLTGDVSEADSCLIQAVLGYFHVASLDELQQSVLTNFGSDKASTRRLYADLAPVVTIAASGGSPVARRVCYRIIEEIACAIYLIAGCFAMDRIPVALVGGVFSSEYVTAGLTTLLALWPKKTLQVVNPVLPPVAGAVLLALESVGMPVTPKVVENLMASTSLY